MAERTGTIDGKEMNAVEARKDLIKSALDASPHKIAIISFNKDGVNSTTVVWQDDKGNIFFAENVQAPVQWGAAYPEGMLKAVAEAQTVKAFPLDFSLKHGAAASAKAELFVAELKENMAKETAEEAAQRAFEKVDPNFGVTPLGAVQSFLPESTIKERVDAWLERFFLHPREFVEAQLRDQAKGAPGSEPAADEFKWAKDFPEAAEYLEEALAELLNKIDDGDRILTKSFLKGELNEIVQGLKEHYTDAWEALAENIRTEAAKTNFFAEMASHERLFEELINNTVDNMPGMPGVLDAARQNSALGLESNLDEIEADDVDQAPDGGGVKSDDYRPYPPAPQPGDPGVKADNYKGPLAFAGAVEIAQIAIASAAEKDASTHNADSENAASNGNEEASTAKAEPGSFDHELGTDAQLAAPFITAHEDSFTEQGTQPQEAATYGEEGASQEQVAVASDTATDGDEGASHSDQVAVASDTDEEAPHSEQVVATDTTTDGEHSEQVAIASDTATDDEGASQEQVAVASDTATDGDEGASHSEQVAIVSDAESASINYAAVMETAKAEVGLTLDDQAGPPGQPATSAVFSQEDSLSFSAFAKQGPPAEVTNQGMPAEFAKQGMPADQLPAEAISTPGAPAGESAHHDVGSEDVGNAAPSKDPVVYHGDLAP
jgi:hypothetical protein